MKLFIFTFFTLVSVYTFSQEKSKIKFGDITVNDFAKKVYEIDSSAQAVVLADIGFSTIEGNDKGWFSLVHKHFKRVH
ncbi:MAG: hypothetical protein WBC06_06925, partial [Chitinophagaceae bacterium]